MQGVQRVHNLLVKGIMVVRGIQLILQHLVQAGSAASGQGGVGAVVKSAHPAP